MPNYKGHLVGGTIGFGLIIFLCSLHVAPCATLVEWFTCVLAGSLFPDIDTKSKGQKIFYLLLCAAMLICALQKKFTLLGCFIVAGMLPLLSKHRGLFHNLWFIIATLIIIVIYMTSLYPSAYKRIVYDAGFFLFGVMSHLYLDVGMRRMLRLS